MHFFLNQPQEFYEPFMKKTMAKMDRVHWLCKEIVTGDFAYDKAVQPGALEDFVKQNENKLGDITQHWGFVKKMVQYSYHHIQICIL
jgi:hypothetical protein